MTISLLECFGMWECKAASTPFPGGTKLTKSTEDKAASFQLLDLPYRSGLAVFHNTLRNPVCITGPPSNTSYGS
ncbi:hypothetical protein CROQUDRAFT_102595 [Cronartium quercuum f. sp. fusiforme G11]|uniref:Uncharacterized protein n=1 Tax=Cronartium quercuum f. sp. fusiforme G11 TaxID=708437 RepID=A0A9P6T609_9BASI|nr:hypothetical protein CROQUDRAFT_102595 [Cronartium quercuum f. sp. fusiforme G11]